MRMHEDEHKHRIQESQIWEVNSQGGRCKGSERADWVQEPVLEVMGTITRKTRRKGSGYTRGGGGGVLKAKGTGCGNRGGKLVCCDKYLHQEAVLPCPEHGAAARLLGGLQGFGVPVPDLRDIGWDPNIVEDPDQC